jgi:hypothetical protein
MIRPLRQRHYHIFAAIGLILPVVFAFGIAARKPFPTMDALPGELGVPVQKFPIRVWQRANVFANSPIQVSLLRDNLDNRLLAMALAADKNHFIKPDLMVYWVDGQPTVNATLPDQAKLLGGFNSGAMPLPAEAAVTNGVLVLYSLADNEIVDVSKPIQFNQPTR